MIVLKLGGSLITEKSSPETLDGRALDAAADAVAGAAAGADTGAAAGADTGAAAGADTGAVDGTDRGRSADLALVHGAGSFGHHHADRHGMTVTAGLRDAAAVMDVHGAMTTLNRFVLDRLHERGVDALPVHPLSTAARDGDADLTLPLDQVRAMLGEGFLPVLHGDGVAHAGEGVTVLSGDEVVVRLARDLDADRVGLCSTVPGVLDADGEVIPRIDAFEDAADALGGSDATDVTGGMAGKVRTLLDLDAPAHVFGLDDLEAFLAGEAVGTRVG